MTFDSSDSTLFNRFKAFLAFMDSPQDRLWYHSFSEKVPLVRSSITWQRLILKRRWRAGTGDGWRSTWLSNR
jgi:hypothetical protein